MLNEFVDKQKVELLAPLTGKLLSLTEVPDEVFAAQTVGEGAAIEPTDNRLLAPVAGVIRQVFPTKHAIALETVSGIKILIHIGINTVKLEGQGFKILVEQGEEVTTGDELVRFNLDYIKNNACSIITPIIITNSKEFSDYKIKKEGEKVTAGKDAILEIAMI